MANKASLDLSKFEDWADEISREYGDDKLLEVATEVIEESRKFVNGEIGKALKKSKFSFDKGDRGSQGKTRESLIDVSKMPVEVVGKRVTAYAGVDLKEAPEALILAIDGSPKQGKDTQLSNAVRVKGSTKKRLEEMQSEIFSSALRK
jgi:hypothetical protein